MKLKPVLALSLVVNLALVVALAWAIKGRTAGPSATPSTPATEGIAKPGRPPATETTAPAADVEPVRPAQAFDWRMVESDDYKKYIANLRAIGCPEETIRDIIIADVNKLFESRKRALKTASTNKFEYWKAGNIFAGMMDPDRIEKEQALAKEKRELLKALLGVAPEEKPNLMAAFNPFETMLDFLPETKQTEVLEIYQKYQARMMKGFSGGTPDADDMKQMQKNQKDMEAELAGLLTPEEFQNYQLRMSQTAMTMRMQLAGFDPSEQEFLDVFKARKRFDDEFGLYGMGSTDKAEREKRDAAKKQLDDQIKSILGEKRYADYERSQDYTYQGIYRVAEKNNLGKEAAVKVYDMKRLAEEQVKGVRKDTSLTREQREAALQGIRSETENSIRTVFGDKAFQSYQNQPGAYWLKNISPDKKPETP